MDRRLLEYLVALAEKRKLSEAAAVCFITRSALSQRLTRLEQDLAIRLFVRHGNTWTPTKAGEIYLAGARTILNVHDAILKNIKELTNRNSDKIILGIAPERSSLLVPLVYPHFHSAFPNASIKLINKENPELLQMVMDGGIDLAVALIFDDCRQEEKRLLDAESVCKEELVLIVPPGHPIASRAEKKGDPLRLVDLSDEKFICHARQKNKSMRRFLDNCFKQVGFVPKELFEVGSTRSVIEFVGKGIGISFVPKMFVRSNASVCIVPTSPRITWDIGVVFRKGKKLSMTEQTLIDLVAGEFRAIAMEEPERDCSAVP